jgi:hypothetical protein
MFRYEGIFKVVGRRYDEEGVLRRMELGQFEAKTKRAAKRRAKADFSDCCDVGSPRVFFVAHRPEWKNLMDRFRRRGKYETTRSNELTLSDEQRAVRREAMLLARSRRPVNARRELSAAEKRGRNQKNRAASKQRKINARRGA